jgi:ubiquinone/menaquinone biosynthesis C-methylase UbiE
MGWWKDEVVPHIVDVTFRGREIDELRSMVCEGLHGRVLEIGFGSGLNVRWYPEAVTQVDVVDPSEVAWQKSADRRLRTTIPIGRIARDAERLTVADGTYDAALVTFSLCTIDDPDSALREVRRVLKPGARLHFLEHGLSDNPNVIKWQIRLAPLQRRFAGGCHLTRDPAELFERAGLTVRTLERGPLPGGPRPFTEGYVGEAVRT